MWVRQVLGRDFGQLQRNIHRADRYRVLVHSSQNQVGWACPAPLQHTSHHLHPHPHPWPLAIAQAETEKLEVSGVQFIDHGVVKYGLDC